MLPADIDFPFEQDGHLGGRVAFTEDDGPRLRKNLGAMDGQPLVVRLFQVVKGAYFLQCLYQFGNSRRVVGCAVRRWNRGETRDRSLGRHGTSRCCFDLSGCGLVAVRGILSWRGRLLIESLGSEPVGLFLALWFWPHLVLVHGHGINQSFELVHRYRGLVAQLSSPSLPIRITRKSGGSTLKR